jgi:ribosomal protein L7/L12
MMRISYSDIGVTLNTYTHLGLMEAKEDVERLEKERKEKEKKDGVTTA